MGPTRCCLLEGESGWERGGRRKDRKTEKTVRQSVSETDRQISAVVFFESSDLATSNTHLGRSTVSDSFERLKMPCAGKLERSLHCRA